MFVGLADYNYREYARIFLASLLNNGRVGLDKIQYFIFDFSPKKAVYRTHCYSMLTYLLNTYPMLNARIIPFEDMRRITGWFSFFYRKFGVRYFKKITIIDYLKAYLFKYIRQPYIFLDSDIIVRKPLSSFWQMCMRQEKLAMSIFRGYSAGLYCAYYDGYAQKDSFGRYRRKWAVNNGVIFIPRDYTSLWRDIFSQVIQKHGMASDLALGVWNVLFWVAQGKILPDKYNYIYTDKNIRARDDVAIIHFLLSNKEKMLQVGKKEKLLGNSRRNSRRKRF